MFPIHKLGSAATALGNVVAPRPDFRPRSSVFSPSGLFAQSTPRAPSRTEADLYLWSAEQTWRSAPGTGRVLGALAGIGVVLWFSTKKGSGR